MLKIYNKNINLNKNIKFNKNICIIFIQKLNFVSIWRGQNCSIFTKIGTKLRQIKIKGPNWD